jgi:ZIP family zinc transporter
MARFASAGAERFVSPVTDPVGAPNEGIAAKNQNFPLGLIVAVAVDLIVDGLLIGVGFAASAGTGRLLAIALTIELLSLGLAVAVQLSDRVVSHWRVLLSVTGLAILFTITAISGATLFHNLPDSVLATVISFGVAALLFLVTEELLVEAHEVPETPVSTAMFFLGFLSLFILELVG